MDLEFRISLRDPCKCWIAFVRAGLAFEDVALAGVSIGA